MIVTHPMITTKTTDWLAGLTCVVAGVLIAALPHLIAWATTGRPDYVASLDDRHYLAIGGQAYFDHPSLLTDPCQTVESPVIYRRLPLLPGILSAKLFGLGPLGVGLMWRALGGATAGLGWYILFRLKVSRPSVAASLSLIVLCDTGLTQGTPLVRLFKRAAITASLPANSLIYETHWIHLEWRSINPATTMVYLIACIWAVLRAREAPTRARIAVAGLIIGLQFYVYFYHWTAAGLALLLALALDTGYRRLYFHAGWIGGLIGLPAIVSDFLLKHSRSDDWLARMDFFLPIGRFDDLALPRELPFFLLLGLFVVVRRRDLIFVWALGVAGLSLENHQIITGLQLDNYHWEYVWGPALCYLTLVVAAAAVEGRKAWSPEVCTAIGAVAVAAFCVGLWVRAAQATRYSESIANDRIIAAYRAQFPPGGTAKFAHNSVVAGDTDFVDFAAILSNLRPLDGWTVYNSLSVTDAQLDDRAALNDLLLGFDRSSFEARQRSYYSEYLHAGAVARNPSLIPVRVADRVAAYDRARADLPAALNRFAVRYVGLPTGTRPLYLRQGWTMVSGGPTWEVWERTTKSPP
jgi:hypothetical protein